MRKALIGVCSFVSAFALSSAIADCGDCFAGCQTFCTDTFGNTLAGAACTAGCYHGCVLADCGGGG